ncbi:MauE/DoxX family redox-associated membrane protein [Streptosporangium soli]|nr:hypothetical protein [Streptosporangium sp. KLBMP 9127]
MIYVVVGCQAALIGVFLFSVVGKIRTRHAYDEFVSSVVAMRALPRSWTRSAAIATIAAEAAAVALLAIPATVPAGFLLAAGLLTIFTVAISNAVRHGRRAPCRCFGASTTPLGRVHMVRNLVLLSACLAGLTAIWRETWAAPHLGGLVISLGAAAIIVLLVVRLDDLVGLFGSDR